MGVTARPKEMQMARISKQETATVYEMEGFEGRYEDLDGYTVGWESYTEDADPSPLFAGLPGDRCQCPHWGVVLRGTLVYTYDDGSEDVIGAGEAYYARPGHLPRFTAGTDVVEFSPTDELAKTIEVVMSNLASMAGAGG
ncbi:MAG: cupin domain-containing protein [Actinomycetota bacterium]